VSKLLQKERIKREEKRYKKKLREAQTSADKTDAGRYTRQAEETLIKIDKLKAESKSGQPTKVAPSNKTEPKPS
jgi:hypothetical protein